MEATATREHQQQQQSATAAKSNKQEQQQQQQGRQLQQPMTMERYNCRFKYINLVLNDVLFYSSTTILNMIFGNHYGLF
jgi:hypothetical protein